MDTTDNLLLSEAKDVSAPARASANNSSRRVLRVWIVDDNAALRELFAQLLSNQPGIRCTRQFPSAEAILAALAEERPPDVVLLDINLGNKNGLSAIRPIKALAPPVKVLMLTMFNNTHYEREAFHSGASGFLLKSYGIDEIAQLIHEAYRNPGALALFPNMVLFNEVEMGSEEAGARASSKRFSLVGALRQLCGAPRGRSAT